MTEDEEFFAWLDGELDADRAARVEARVAASPELADRASEHRRMAAELRDAFKPVMQARAPSPRFESAEVIEFGARPAGREAWRPQFRLSQWAAMAATLALGLLVGNLVGRDGEFSPVAVDNGRLVASASLKTTLDSGLASEPAADRVRIGLTFRDARGTVCRSFQDGPAAGLACREGDRWRIEALVQESEGQFSDYRMAAGQNPTLTELIDRTIAGEPFDAAQERAARDSGWR